MEGIIRTNNKLFERYKKINNFSLRILKKKTKKSPYHDWKDITKGTDKGNKRHAVHKRMNTLIPINMKTEEMNIFLEKRKVYQSYSRRNRKPECS